PLSPPPVPSSPLQAQGVGTRGRGAERSRGQAHPPTTVALSPPPVPQLPHPRSPPPSPGRRGQASGGGRGEILNVTPKQLSLPREPEGGGPGASCTLGGFPRRRWRGALASWLRARPRLRLLRGDQRAGPAAVRRVQLRAPHGRRPTPPPRGLGGARARAPRGGHSEPRPSVGGAAPPGRPISGRPCAGLPRRPPPPAGRRHVRVFAYVRLPRGGQGRAGRAAGRGGARAAAGGGAGAGAARGPGNLNSPAPGGPRTRTSRPAATAPPLCTGPGPPVLCVRRKMQLLDCNPEVDGVQHLLEAGASVNAPPDPCEQAPVHLAAGGGLACFLLWQLQSGADLNQQDVFGEAPLHKAAKVGSLECLSLLVASDAQIDLCNKNGQTAEDLAWACGFLECAKFLTTIKCMQTIKSSDRSDRDHCVPVLRQKRSFGSAENTTGKRKC
uniref:Ankyrin repeat domain-containing protein 37 n=2 Tax=Canis lupus familiaris TaxID=9615 RepID=A0A8C0SBN9_CANLF